MVRRAAAQSADDDDVDISKSVRTRRRILDAAAHELSVRGYSGTRLSHIADYAGIQAPAIYYHFPSRDALIEEVMWVGIAEMREYLLAAIAAADPDCSPMDRIMIAVEAHLQHELDISDYATASIRNSGQVPDNIRARQKAENGKYGEVWRTLFNDAMAAGQIRNGIDLGVARLLVIGALNWAAEWWNPRRGSLTTVVATAQSMVRAGLSPPPEEGVDNATGRRGSGLPRGTTRTRKTTGNRRVPKTASPPRHDGP